MNEDQQFMPPDGVELEDASSDSAEIEATTPGPNEPAGAAIESFEQEEPTYSDTGILKKASRDFATYCESEIHHRRNSGDAFDEVLFEQAVEMTVRRLQTLESEGIA
jgi:hypothetical protein